MVNSLQSSACFGRRLVDGDNNNYNNNSNDSAANISKYNLIILFILFADRERETMAMATSVFILEEDI